jgi:hypothetical protein
VRAPRYGLRGRVIEAQGLHSSHLLGNVFTAMSGVIQTVQ